MHAQCRILSCSPRFKRALNTRISSSYKQMSSHKLLRKTVSLYPRSSSPVSPSFSVLQWNILADGLAQNGDFVRANPCSLEWHYRLPLLLAELQEANADIICVQELNHFDDLKQRLETLGYQAAGFLPKHCSPAARYNCEPDGLAIFYLSKRFKLVGPVKGHYYTDASGETASQGYLYATLEDVHDASKRLVVATTHLKAKEGGDMDQIRLRQMTQLLGGLASELDQEIPHNSNGNGNNEHSNISRGHTQRKPPVLIAGDFNATPNSDACQALESHPAQFRSLWDVPVGDNEQLTPANHPQLEGGGTFSSGGSLDTGEAWQQAMQASAGNNEQGCGRSVDAQAQGTGQELAVPFSGGGEFSTWKFRSKGESKRIIDHMWWTEGRGLRPVARWRMLSEQEIGPCALPSAAYASDHIALCAEFEWQ